MPTCACGRVFAASYGLVRHRRACRMGRETMADLAAEAFVRGGKRRRKNEVRCTTNRVFYLNDASERQGKQEVKAQIQIQIRKGLSLPTPRTQCRWTNPLPSLKLNANFYPRRGPEENATFQRDSRTSFHRIVLPSHICQSRPGHRRRLPRFPLQLPHRLPPPNQPS